MKRICSSCNKNEIKRKDAKQCGECYIKSMKKENHPSWTGCRVCPRCNGQKFRKSKLCLKCTYDTKYIGKPKCKNCNTPVSRYDYQESLCRKCYRGNLHPAWNSELTQAERDNPKVRLYNPLYSQWRKKVWQKNEYKCQCCGDSKVRNLTAHHIENYSSVKHKRYDIDNGVTLCKKCHNMFHKIYGKRNNSLNQLIQYIGAYGKSNLIQGKLF